MCLVKVILYVYRRELSTPCSTPLHTLTTRVPYAECCVFLSTLYPQSHIFYYFCTRRELRTLLNESQTAYFCAKPNNVYILK